MCKKLKYYLEYFNSFEAEVDKRGPTIADVWTVVDILNAHIYDVHQPDIQP